MKKSFNFLDKKYLQNEDGPYFVISNWVFTNSLQGKFTTLSRVSNTVELILSVSYLQVETIQASCNVNIKEHISINTHAINMIL